MWCDVVPGIQQSTFPRSVLISLFHRFQTIHYFSIHSVFISKVFVQSYLFFVFLFVCLFGFLFTIATETIYILNGYPNRINLPTSNAYSEDELLADQIATLVKDRRAWKKLGGRGGLRYKINQKTHHWCHRHLLVNLYQS